MIYNKKHTYILYILVIVAIVISVVAMSDITGNVAAEPNGEWKCSAANCTQYVTGNEWAQRFCGVQNGQTVCAVKKKKKKKVYPLASLDVSQIGQCIAYKCIQETYIRNVDYPISQQP